MNELDLSILSKLRPATSKKTPRKSYVGQVFERLTVYALIGYHITRERGYWLCRCKCGNWRIISIDKLQRKAIKSCGCYRDDTRGNNNRTHGMTRTPSYRRHADMLTRATNPNTNSAHNYVERGITTCEGLRKFENFYALLGDPPTGYQLDRKDNDGNYSCGSCEECLSKNWPMNVRWVTPTVNGRNTRKNVFLTANGETHCISEWAELLGKDPLRIASRRRRGWSDEEALGLKERQRSKYPRIN